MLKNHVLVFMFHPFRATNKNETAISCGTVVSNGWGGEGPFRYALWVPNVSNGWGRIPGEGPRPRV